VTVPDSLKAALAGRYDIEGQIGSGGMATVYRARDLRHDRRVALKVLRPEVSAALGPDRFLTEIRVTANLRHPHILPLFDSGDGGGTLYYVMPLIDGESLRQRLDREKQLPVEVSVRIAEQAARALDHAHRQGVLHRDIKPENILLQDGEVLVADFGIALALSHVDADRLTGTGVSVGTPAYMSPEQISGERQLDARTDLYSLGCVLYEMLAGTPPHSARTAQALMASVLTAQPLPIGQLRPTVPPHIAAALERALAKLPADRFATAAELADALGPRVSRPASLPAAPSPAGPVPNPWRQWGVRGGALAGLAAFVGAWVAFGTLFDSGRSPPRDSAATDDVPVVAVLPFGMSGAEVGLQPADMVELLTMNLDGLGGLRAVSARTLLQRWQERVGDAASADLPTMLDVARAVEARYALTGSVVAVGSGMRLAATAYDLSTDSEIGSHQVDGSIDSILALTDELTVGIFPALFDETPELRAPRLASITTSSVPALRAYLRGLAEWRIAGNSRPHFEEAVALDSTFALAWLRLANNDSSALARALSMLPRLPPREATMVRVVDAFETGRLQDAQFVQEAGRLYPDDSEIWFRVADYLYHHGSQALLAREESTRAFERSIALDPALLTSYEHLVDDAINAGNLDHARALLSDYIRYSLDRPYSALYLRQWRLLLSILSSPEPAALAVAAVLDSISEPPIYTDPPGGLITLYPFSRGAHFARARDIWPRLVDAREALLAYEVRRSADYPATVSRDLAITALVRGRVSQSRLALDRDPRVSSVDRTLIYYRLWSLGHPLTSDAYDRELSIADSDEPDPIRNLVVGAYAADVARWDDFGRAQRNLETLSGVAQNSGDQSSARLTDFISRALTAYGDARRSRVTQALADLEVVRRSAPVDGSGDLLNTIVRWWLGGLSASEGRNQEALRYFRSFAQDPIGQLMLGRVHERLGDTASARRAYQLALECWKDADADFPLVEEARAALARLAP
jgi:serine/threonine-protein kinase